MFSVDYFTVKNNADKNERYGNEDVADQRRKTDFPTGTECEHIAKV
jgi:hypothetical protein